MRIGVGVTTNGTLSRIRYRNVCDKINTIVIKNKDQVSVAHDKNVLIKQLYDAGCSYIFLFDDDCFPIKEGWERFFIDACERTSVQHFVLCKTPYNEPIGSKDGVSLFHTGTGCMMFLTRKVIETVGYFNPAYGKYGWEHLAYSSRIFRAGLTPAGYVSVDGWEEYIYSWDLQGDTDGGFVKVHQMSSDEKYEYIEANKECYIAEMNSNKLYYKY